jgi:hypothetical protein
MLTDALLQLSSAQAVTSTAYSTNTIDLGVARDIGQGEDLYVTIGVDEAATAAGAATVTFQIVTSANANLSSHNILIQTDAIAKTELTLARKPIVLCIPSSILLSLPVGQRYFGVQYTVATGPLTAGKFTTHVTLDDPGVGKYYASGFSVA